VEIVSFAGHLLLQYSYDRKHTNMSTQKDLLF